MHDVVLILIKLLIYFIFVILNYTIILLFEIFIIKKLNIDNHRLAFYYLMYCMASIERCRHADQYQGNIQYASGILG